MKKFWKFFLLVWLTGSSLNVSGQWSVENSWYQSIKNSLNSINKSASLRIDKDGNCYVLGTTWLPDSTKDILLIKFASDGTEVWRRVYDNPSHGDDIPMNMNLDREGNIWVCGMAKPSINNGDFLLVKFNPDGIPVVDELYDGRDHLFDCATTVVADKAGNIYAGGYETSLDSGINMMLVKYNSGGAMLWRRKYSTRQMDIANEIIVDDSCNVYLTGTSNNGPHTSDILIQKYDSTGRLKWQVIYDGKLSQNDNGQFITMDDSSYIYVSGFLNHANNRADIPIIKLNRNGQIISEILYNGRIADCGATAINAGRKTLDLIGLCNDYNIQEVSSFLIRYNKGGKQLFSFKTPVDYSFLKTIEVGGNTLLACSKLTHPESTLTPCIAGFDSAGVTWDFADSTVYGLAHITDVATDGNAVYFLGDDTGAATGTISIFKYILAVPEDEVNTPSKRLK